MPHILGNYIKGSKHYGILIKGELASPFISKNEVCDNKRTGIRLTDDSSAEIVDENKIWGNYA